MRVETLTKHADMTPKARALRRPQTAAEKALWMQLAGRRFDGVKFRRQHPIGRYIVDFVSLEHRLAVELDGGHHDRYSKRSMDQGRTDWLDR